MKEEKIMKKIYLFLAAVSVTAMFSACMKESTPEIQADGTVLTAGILLRLVRLLMARRYIGQMEIRPW